MTTSTLTHVNIDEIQQQLWQENDAGKVPVVYAFLGGARDRQIEKIIRLGKLKYDCLIDGKLSYEMAIAAPYIVRLERGHPQTIEIIKKGWGNSWGIFAITYPPASFINIRHNCKKMAKVVLPNKKKAFFRYYDPRVMRPYLPTCTTDEAQQVFGHVSEYIMEGEAPGTIHRFKRSEEGVIDINANTVSNNAQSEHITVNSSLENQEIITALRTQLGHAFIQQAKAFLKLKALAYTDPNDEIALNYLLDTALLLAHTHNFIYQQANELTDMAHTLDLWGNTYTEKEWAKAIFQRRTELSLSDKIIEIFREKAFQQAGPEAMDYSTYCILRFKDRNIDPEYSNQDIFIAANIGLEIAKSHNITDLNNTYMCTEMVLIYGDNFVIEEQCQPIKAIFEDETRSSFDKTYDGFYWLASAMQHSFEYDSLV